MKYAGYMCMEKLKHGLKEDIDMEKLTIEQCKYVNVCSGDIPIKLITKEDTVHPVMNFEGTIVYEDSNFGPGPIFKGVCGREGGKFVSASQVLRQEELGRKTLVHDVVSAAVKVHEGRKLDECKNKHLQDSRGPTNGGNNEKKSE